MPDLRSSVEAGETRIPPFRNDNVVVAIGRVVEGHLTPHVFGANQAVHIIPMRKSQVRAGTNRSVFGGRLTRTGQLRCTTERSTPSGVMPVIVKT